VETIVTQNENRAKGNTERPSVTRLAASVGVAVAVFAQSGRAAEAPVATLDEVIVTAEKKEERIQDVPIPISVLQPQDLADTGQGLLRDYYQSVPGFTVSPNLQGAQMLSIRGITTGGFTAPTVGIILDDVPLGINNSGTPDIDPGDLARIEVLRGPQGTLYGASAMGGLIKYVTADPSPTAFSARVQAGASDVENGDKVGYDFRATANLPLSDTAAVRVSGFARQDPGYIDNVLTGQNGINKATTSGARVAALWRPSDELTIKLSGLYQRTTGDGYSDVDLVPGLGSLQQNYERGAGVYGRTLQAYSLSVKYQVGNFSVTSLTGFNRNQYLDGGDVSYLNNTNPAVIAIGTPATIQHTAIGAREFTQEVRLSSVIAEKFEWMLGGFYSHEYNKFAQTVEPENALTGQILTPLLWHGDFPGEFEERAGFANLTYHVSDQFDIQVGGRESFGVGSTVTYYAIGPLFGGSATVPYVNQDGGASSNAFTYQVTPRYKISPDLMVYFRAASGYRPGGSQVIQAVPDVPPVVSPDKTRNYELGAKGDFLDHTFSVDASIYYIDWQNIQVFLNSPLGLGYQGNAGGAKSQGVELSVQSRPVTGLTLSAWIDYDDAVITKVPPGGTVYEYPGDRLPNSARWSGNVSAQQTFPLSGSLNGFVGAAVSYVGDRLGVFTGSPNNPAPRQRFPSYTKTDLRTGLTLDTWTATLYVNNLADVRGVLNGGAGYSPPYAFQYIVPRTIGITVVKLF
jgi:outer membrane receptor protein involved in Fe transport